MFPCLILRLLQRFDALNQVVHLDAFAAGLEQVGGGTDP
jgi:hypothetical protein